MRRWRRTWPCRGWCRWSAAACRCSLFSSSTSTPTAWTTSLRRRQLKTHRSVPALDSAGCRCECRVRSSHRRCCDCTASPAPSLQMSRRDSTGTRTSDQYSDHCDDFLRVLRRRVNGVQQFATRRAAAGTRMPYGITRCYLPPGRGDTSKLVMSDYGLSRRC